MDEEDRDEEDLEELEVMGEAAGDCIHCYVYRGLRLCSLNDMVCDEDDVKHCIHFEKRE